LATLCARAARLRAESEKSTTASGRVDHGSRHSPLPKAAGRDYSTLPAASQARQFKDGTAFPDRSLGEDESCCCSGESRIRRTSRRAPASISAIHDRPDLRDDRQTEVTVFPDTRRDNTPIRRVPAYRRVRNQNTSWPSDTARGDETQVSHERFCISGLLFTANAMTAPYPMPPNWRDASSFEDGTPVPGNTTRRLEDPCRGIRRPSAR